MEDSIFGFVIGLILSFALSGIRVIYNENRAIEDYCTRTSKTLISYKKCYNETNFEDLTFTKIGDNE